MDRDGFEQTKARALGCTKCSLSKTRTKVVWMDGSDSADLLFIGEAPGFNEDKIGRPFVGAAGKLLDRLLAEQGFDRATTAICNVVKCRPPGNRNPLPAEIESCKPYLAAQIEFIKPAVIVTLGNFATRFILGSQVSISKVRGQYFERPEGLVIPTFHPAAVLHGGGERSPAMKMVRSDFALIGEKVRRMQRETAGPAVADVTAQDSLF